jgi:hypothetical protein
VLKSGTPKIYIKTAESGNKRAHASCPECGAPIYSAAPEPNPATVGLRVGGIDQRAQFEPPIRQGWCRSALPWSMDLTGVASLSRVRQPGVHTHRCGRPFLLLSTGR